MATPTDANRLASYLAPYSFLGGALCAFLTCCLAGWVAGRSNIYHHFVRFNGYINAQTLYYPTASQVRALGRARLDPDKIAVVVGGNSILLGHGVGSAQVWTKHLQEELGDRFEVLNFAIPAALPAEFGGIAAEMLQREHAKLLFVTDCGSSTFPTIPDGQIYRYFFWDAYYKGLISRDARRDARLSKEVEKRSREGESFPELQRGARLDATLRFQDLWTTVAYKHLCTIWTPLTPRHFTWPRRRCVEPEHLPQPPLEQRYPPSSAARAREILMVMMQCGPGLLEGTPENSPLIHYLHECFPEECRRRTLMLVMRDSPHYIAQLSSAEQAAYSSVFPAMARALEAGGMPAMDIGADYSEMDYLDCSHIGEQGGQRLARDIAPKLRGMAEQLGYLKRDSQPNH
jgi:hypothetical protein